MTPDQMMAMIQAMNVNGGASADGANPFAAMAGSNPIAALLPQLMQMQQRNVQPQQPQAPVQGENKSPADDTQINFALHRLYPDEEEIPSV